ncbi:hypothetical protein [Nocardia sienata]|uniref:hypothetical protein n=1 Tax=Nocardia sienata TaxID=248552 RepID=UPI0007A47AA7|nr:hypothetical protein [Nocardia sienata]
MDVHHSHWRFAVAWTWWFTVRALEEIGRTTIACLAIVPDDVPDGRRPVWWREECADIADIEAYANQ